MDGWSFDVWIAPDSDQFPGTPQVLCLGERRHVRRDGYGVRMEERHVREVFLPVRLTDRDFARMHSVLVAVVRELLVLD